MSQNLLKKTRCYLVGPMQFSDGRNWRNVATEELSKMGIVVFNPYNKPFIEKIDEDENFVEKMVDKLDEGKYNEVHRAVKRVRYYDLSLVDKSDFIIAYINPIIPSFGTIEEISWGCRLKRPIFVWTGTKKKDCPLWIFGMISPDYIFGTLDEVMHVLRKINDGDVELDPKRWRLLKGKYR